MERKDGEARPVCCPAVDASGEEADHKGDEEEEEEDISATPVLIHDILERLLLGLSVIVVVIVSFVLFFFFEREKVESDASSRKSRAVGVVIRLASGGIRKTWQKQQMMWLVVWVEEGESE